MDANCNLLSGDLKTQCEEAKNVAQNMLDKACDNLSGDLKTQCEAAKEKNGALATEVKS